MTMVFKRDKLDDSRNAGKERGDEVDRKHENTNLQKSTKPDRRYRCKTLGKKYSEKWRESPHF